MIFRFGNYRLDTGLLELRRGADPVPVEPQVFDLLRLLLENRERVVGKDEIVDRVWGGRIVSEATMSSRMNAVRRAVGDDGKRQEVIRTLPRRGFRFVHAVEVDDDARLPAQAAEPSGPEGVFGLPSIAVLPLENMSGDPEQEYFSDGVTEDLITALARVRQFRVLARNSTLSYKGQTPDVRKVAAELGVRYVIEGSVRKSGKRIRVTAQLIDGRSGDQLWAERYDRDLEDVFDVQDALVETIVGMLEPEVSKAEIRRALSKKPESLDAWDLCQRGLWHFQRRTRKDVAEAERHYRSAIALNPGFGPAYSGLAQTIIYEVLIGVRDTDTADSPEAVQMALKAVEIDDADALAWCWLGRAYAFNRMHDEAVAAYRKAIDLDPCHALAYYHLAASLTILGHAREAIGHFHTALRLSPRDPWVGSIMGRLAEAHLAMENHEEAVRWGRSATLQPGPGANLWTNRIAMVAALGHLARKDEAQRELQGLQRVQPGISRTFVRQRFPSAESPFMTLLVEGLRKAGLPE